MPEPAGSHRGRFGTQALLLSFRSAPTLMAEILATHERMLRLARAGEGDVSGRRRQRGAREEMAGRVFPDVAAI